MTDHAPKFAPHELFELSEPIHDLRKLYPRLKRGKDNKSKKCFIHDQHEVDAILAGEGEMEFSKHISKQFLENLQEYVRETVDDRDVKYQMRVERSYQHALKKRKEHESYVATTQNQIHELAIDNARLKKN